MAFDISEIKKLSVEERLRIIAELWESIESERKQEDEFVVNEEEESPEIIAMLEERLAEYERGEGNSYTWEEAKAILEKNLEELRRNKNA